MAGDMFEIESSRLALQRSQNPAIRNYAARMVRDHSMTMAVLSGQAPRVASGTVGGAAVGAGVGAVAAGPVGALVGAGVGAATTGAGTTGGPLLYSGPAVDPRYAAMMGQLAATSGRDFDSLYRQMQLTAHQEAIGLYTAYASQPDDPGLGAFAQQMLPSLRAHYARARRL